MESSMSEMGKNTLPRPGRQGAFSMGAPGPGPAPGYQKWLPGKPLTAMDITLAPLPNEAVEDLPGRPTIPKCRVW